MDPPKREQTSLTDSCGRSAREQTWSECVSFVATRIDEREQKRRRRMGWRIATPAPMIRDI